VTDRIKAERKILDDQKQLRHLASELLLIEERERRKVATGLHDSIGQILAFSSIELANTLRDAPDQMVKPLSHIRKMIELAITETRDLTFDLSPSVLYTFGLAAAIEQLIEQFSEEHGFRGDLQLNAQPDSISEEITILLYRSVRELLINIAKHAKAKNVYIEFSLVDEHFEITIEDDGKGFDINKLEKVSKKKNRFGLLSVRERLSHFNGQFNIQSNPGEGTTIKLAVPIEDKCTLKTRRD
jgi:signal transduction histidine kinase